MTSRSPREGNTGNDGSVSREHGVASRVALVLTSDEELRRLFSCGFRENPEECRQHLATCVRFLATEAKDHATLKYERKAATFIAEHISAITRQIRSGETALGNEKVPASFPGSLSEAVDADASVGVISQDEFLIQSNFAAVQRFILESEIRTEFFRTYNHIVFQALFQVCVDENTRIDFFNALTSRATEVVCMCCSTPRLCLVILRYLAD
jgi:hypothetical protein